MRNDAQKLAFALNCREIEKEGGDVLAFIEQNWPSYTPRATWYNLQRQFLHRTTSQLTEGKAVDPEEMRTRELKTDKAKQLEMVMKILQEGGDPIAYLADLGYKVPTQAWADLRVWARKHRPDDRAKMPDNLKVYYKEHGLQGWRPDPKTVVKTPEDYKKKYPGGIMSKKAVQKPAEEPKMQVEDEIAAWDPSKAEEIGKRLKEMPTQPVLDVSIPAASPTCCQPARPSGVTVPDEIPLTVCGVRSGFRENARFETADESGFMTFVWTDVFGNEEKRLTLSAEEWKRMTAEIPQAMRQLGVSE